MNSTLPRKDTITLVIVAITIAAILTYGGHRFYSNQEQSIRKVKYNELNAIAELKTQQIDRWRKDRIGDANIAAQSPFFQKAVNEYISNNNTALKKDILDRMKLLKAQYGYENVMIFSAKGEKMLSVDSRIDECKPNRQLLTVTSASFSDFFYCSVNNHIYLDIVAPISIQNTIAKAYLVLRIDPEHYLYPLIQTWPLPSKSGETLLLRKDSTRITFLNELRFSKNAALNLHIDLSHTEVPGVKAALGGTGIYEGYDYRNVMVVSDIRHIPDSPWFMVAKIDKSEIFSELYYRAIGIVAIILISTILITIALALYFKNRQTSIYKKLFLTEKELRNAEEEFRTILYSIADAVITTAADGKVKMMNHMAEKLTGWTETEASGKKLEDIFHLVTEETNAPVEYSLKKVRCDKNSVIQDYRVMLVARNGNRVPVTASMASINPSSNKANGVVIVFHDQTAEREAAQQLEKNEKLFRNVFEYSLIGKSITDFHGKINVNRAFCQMLGYTKEELSGKPWRSITHLDDIERDQQKIEAIRAGDKPFDKWEKRYIHKNGTVVYCEIMTTLLRDAAGNMLYFISAINDITERKKMEQALKDSEAILRETGRIAKVGGWEFDVATLKGTWTEEVALIHDLDPKDETNVEVGLSFYSPANRVKIEQAIANAIEKQTPYDLELELTTQNNNHKWVRTIGNPVVENGKVVRIRGSFQDITKIKRSELSLKRQNDELQLLFSISQTMETSGDFVSALQLTLEQVCIATGWALGEAWFPNNSNTQLDYSKAWYSTEQALLPYIELSKKYHFERGEGLPGRVWQEKKPVWIKDVQHYHDFHRSKEAIEFGIVAGIGVPVLSEKEVICIIVFFLKERRDEDEQFIQLASNIALQLGQLYQRKKAEESLIESEARLRLSLNAAQQGLYDLNIQTGECIVNDQYALMLGYDPATFVETNNFWIERLHPEDKPITEKAYLDYVNEVTDEYKVEFRQKTKDGSWKWIMSVGKIAEYDSSGAPLRMLGTHTDITIQKEAENEIKMLNETLEQRVIERTAQLEAVNKELEAFSYSVSHDLRAPLRHINGFGDLLIKKYANELNPEAQRYISTITQSAQQMGTLIDDLLQFSRTGRAEMKKHMLDANKLVQEVVSSLANEMDGRQIEWIVKPLPEIYGDFNLLRQVWINLVDNAVKYTRTREVARIEIGCNNKSEPVFYVKDNGVGFDMRYAQKLFGVFQRLHTASEFEGTGIGLANVKRIITRHGGKIWAEAEPNKGTTFFFTIPKNQ